MILCLVTDRRRLGAAMGAPEGGLGRRPARSRSRAAAEAGVDYIQVREPDLEARELAALVAVADAASGGTARPGFWSTTALMSRWPPRRRAFT